MMVGHWPATGRLVMGCVKPVRLERVYQEIQAFSHLTPWPPLPSASRRGEGEKSRNSPLHEAKRSWRGAGGEARSAGKS
jgi:hypothetical protein